MSKAIEELLASVAREFATDKGEYNRCMKVLTERLGPLLEAGQAMRNEMEAFDTFTQLSHFTTDEVWDAALAAGKGQA